MTGRPNNSRPLANIATGIRFAWNQLTQKFQDVVTNEHLLDPSGLLLKQDVCWAGFYTDGTIALSVMMVLTMELENQREKHLGI